MHKNKSLNGIFHPMQTLPLFPEWLSESTEDAIDNDCFVFVVYFIMNEVRKLVYQSTSYVFIPDGTSARYISQTNERCIYFLYKPGCQAFRQSKGIPFSCFFQIFYCTLG
jgi:hypothetical protein